LAVSHNRERTTWQNGTGEKSLKISRGRYRIHPGGVLALQKVWKADNDRRGMEKKN
jgi:hypothetical protein